MYRCIVVEDEKIIRKWLRYGFDYSSHQCVVIDEARDGEEGLQKIKELRPDIVITDITMPRKNAFEMLEATGELVYATIIISGYTDFNNAQQAIHHGAIEFIVKPIDEQQLGTALDKAIKNLEGQRLLALSESEMADANNKVIEDLSGVPKDIRVRQMIAYIERHFAEKITFDEVAAAIGYGPSILYKKFKEELGMTFNDYLNKYRIHQAIIKMASPEFKLYEIAEQVGFSDYKYFSKIFNRHTGFSPTEFMDKQVSSTT